MNEIERVREEIADIKVGLNLLGYNEKAMCPRMGYHYADQTLSIKVGNITLKELIELYSEPRLIVQGKPELVEKLLELHE